MRILGHCCSRVITESHGDDFTIVCECSATFATHYRPDAVDAFTAHVIGHVALAALDRERDARPTLDNWRRGLYGQRRRKE